MPQLIIHITEQDEAKIVEAIDQGKSFSMSGPNIRIESPMGDTKEAFLKYIHFQMAAKK